jgi:Holliday junction resolvase-like predicted endonuclease
MKMNDEVIEEIRQIRKTLCEEAKKLTPEQRREKAHVASCWLQQQIEERRTQCEADKVPMKNQ